jgi:hypothetical protein
MEDIGLARTSELTGMMKFCVFVSAFHFGYIVVTHILPERVEKILNTYDLFFGHNIRHPFSNRSNRLGFVAAW